MKIIVETTPFGIRAFGSISAMCEVYHREGVPDSRLSQIVDILKEVKKLTEGDLTIALTEITTWTRRPTDGLPYTIFHKGETYEVPQMHTIEQWAADGIAEALDGCRVEPDGSCEHGSRSWLVVLGLL